MSVSDERRPFSSQEADEAARELPDQVARLREMVRAARIRLSRTARELARDESGDSRRDADRTRDPL